MSGLTGIIQAYTGKDIVTGQQLPESKQISSGIIGVLQMLALGLGVRAAAGGAVAGEAGAARPIVKPADAAKPALIDGANGPKPVVNAGQAEVANAVNPIVEPRIIVVEDNLGAGGPPKADVNNPRVNFGDNANALPNEKPPMAGQQPVLVGGKEPPQVNAAKGGERPVPAEKPEAGGNAENGRGPAEGGDGKGVEAHKPGEAPKKVHVDIGGEGRYPDAINVNPSPTTSTTGTAGRPIPNRVAATGEKTTLANQSADLITLENTPISPGTVAEIARVIKPGGEIRLVGPADYAQAAHQRVIQALPKGATVTQTTVGTGETAITTTIIKLP